MFIVGSRLSYQIRNISSFLSELDSLSMMNHQPQHQCVIAMLQKCSQCVVIETLNKTIASLTNK